MKKKNFLHCLDKIMSSLKLWFGQNKEIFTALSLFSPKRFASILENCRNSEELTDSISAFCKTYSIDPVECARELFNFAKTFNKLKNVTGIDKEEQEENNSDDEGGEFDETDEEGSTG